MGDLCEGCGAGERRYRCPGCGIRTCSLECVEGHKRDSGCEGKRSKTKFVSLSEFTTSQLLSDYHFLEEAGRLVDSAHRGLPTVGRDERERKQRLQRVRAAARRRGISFHLLPAGMARHRANTSRTVWNRDRRGWGIEWRVRLVFPQSELQFTEERVREEVVLADLLKSYLHASASLRKECVEQQVAVFLKTEKVPPSSASYQRLQLQASLGDSLRDRAIIEFPELHIVPLSAAGQYENHLPPSLPLQQTSLARLAAEYCSSSEEGERVL